MAIKENFSVTLPREGGREGEWGEVRWLLVVFFSPVNAQKNGSGEGRRKSAQRKAGAEESAGL